MHCFRQGKEGTQKETQSCVLQENPGGPAAVGCFDCRQRKARHVCLVDVNYASGDDLGSSESFIVARAAQRRLCGADRDDPGPRCAALMRRLAGAVLSTSRARCSKRDCKASYLGTEEGLNKRDLPPPLTFGTGGPKQNLQCCLGPFCTPA